jgi:hypothetical protein
MSREVRRVPADWQHPRDGEGYRPLFPADMYAAIRDEWIAKCEADGYEAAVEWCGRVPVRSDYMPEWTAEEATHFMMYETTSEGTPISPAFATPEELARWLADTGASAFGGMTATYEQWLATCKRGHSMGSAVVVSGHLVSGVAASEDRP